VKDEDEVHKHIMNALRNTQLDLRFPVYHDRVSFPNLRELGPVEMDEIFRRLWPGKAITNDLVADDIFKKGFKERAKSILSDLWSGLDIKDHHFRTRLAPLNKKFPSTPMPDQIRPIIVSSPIVKILETRLVHKLQAYLRDKLHRSQLGFTDGMDIYVNIWRAVKRIEELRDRRKHVYCLFLDFKSAYNTVPHSLLFDKLRGILSTEEIELLRAIYSRMSINIGCESFQPNVGVPQGSVISPSLFNIYAASFLERLEENGWGIHDLLAFADDHLVINITKSSLRLAIRLTMQWCEEVNIQLNPSKSGILEVPPKGGQLTMQVGSCFEGIPIVDEYKYLGLILDNRLSGAKHVNKLFGWKDANGVKHKGKIEFIKNNLCPLIRNISLDYRVNLWQTLIRPLFTPLALLGNFLCQTSKKELERKLKKSMKWFMGLVKSVPDDILFSLVSINFDEWARIESERAYLKWQARLSKTWVAHLPKYKVICHVKYLPREVAQFVNLQCALCPKCKTILTPLHYNMHMVNVPNVSVLLRELRMCFENERDRAYNRPGRMELIEVLASKVRGYIDVMKNFLQR